jgi:hypothetical protein
MTTLFISHGSVDNAWVQALHDVLTDADHQTLFLDFHPRDGIRAGEEWEQALYRHLRQCRGVVALCTEAWLAWP